MPAAPLGRLSTFLLPALALLGRGSLWHGVEAPPSTGAPDRYLFIAIRPGMKAHRELIPYDREIATAGAYVMDLGPGETLQDYGARNQRCGPRTEGGHKAHCPGRVL